jgi:hypothetical protein
MTHDDWIIVAKVFVALPALFYLRVWNLESRRAGSWRAGHANLWKKPKKWQLITFCVLWGFIVVAFLLLMLTRS